MCELLWTYVVSKIIGERIFASLNGMEYSMIELLSFSLTFSLWRALCFITLTNSSSADTALKCGWWRYIWEIWMCSLWQKKDIVHVNWLWVYNSHLFQSSLEPFTHCYTELCLYDHSKLLDTEYVSYKSCTSSGPQQYT